MKTRLVLSGVLVLISLCLISAVAAAGRLHFAGVPRAGVRPSTPIVGRMVVSLRPDLNTTWNIYADGRIIWQRLTAAGIATAIPAGANATDTGYVQQRLTAAGVRLIRSKIAATGLFDQDLALNLRGRKAWLFDRLQIGGRTVTVSVVSSGGSDPTRAELSALASLQDLVADPSGWLPRRAWADRKLRPFVPAGYVVGFDRTAPDRSKLPPLARQALSRYYSGHGCPVTTAHTRALLQAFADSGINPAVNHALDIEFDLVGSEKAATGRRIPSDFHLSPGLPDALC